MASAPPIHVISIATSATLAPMRVMARSLARHQPDWTLELALIGAGARRSAGDEFPTISVEQELGSDAEELLGRHSQAELIPLLVPRLLLSRCRGGRRVLHLPATAWVLDALTPVADALRDHAVLLAPRRMDRMPIDGLLPAAGELTRAGRVAPDFMGVDGSAAAVDFLRWWMDRADRIIGAAGGDPPGHRPGTRHWAYRSLELACARTDTATLQDPGCRLSGWNLDEHRLSTEDGATLVDGSTRLRMLELAGFEPDHPWRLSRLSARIRVSRHPVLRALLVRYAQELRDAGWGDVGHRRELGLKLANGLVFDAPLQELFEVAHTLGSAPDDPLTRAGTAAFMAWLTGPAVLGGRHGVNRYLHHRVLRERADVVAAFPDLDGAGGPGLVAWAHSSGISEMHIPPALLPSAPAEAAALESMDADGSAACEALVATASAAPPRADLPGSPAQPGGLPEPPAAGPVHATEPAQPTTAGPDHPAPIAVRVSGYMGHVLGLGAAARGYASALAAAGVATSTATVSLDHLRPPVELEDAYGRHAHADVLTGRPHGFELICVNPDELPDFVARVGGEHLQGIRIGVWGWETNSIPPRWGPAFSLVEEIWVYSRFVATNIGAVTDVPVVALPPPVTAPTEPAPPNRLGLPDGFLFLFVFDYSSTNQRKNPVGLIEAFKRAFRPDEGPRLLIKTINAPLLPLSEEEVLWAAEGRPDIHIIDRSLTGAEKDALMAGCDCYVSLHRSEGFGLTMAEAMAIGKPVIATGYSGNMDFMNDVNSFLVEYTMTRVGPDCQIYPPDGEWAEPSVEHAAKLMRDVYTHPRDAATRAARARDDIARTLSPQAAGAAMRRRLQELAGHPRPGSPQGSDTAGARQSVV